MNKMGYRVMLYWDTNGDCRCEIANGILWAGETPEAAICKAVLMANNLWKE